MFELVTAILLGIASAIFMAIGVGYIIVDSTPQPKHMEKKNHNNQYAEPKDDLAEYQKVMAVIDKKIEKMPESRDIMAKEYRKNIRKLEDKQQEKEDNRIYILHGSRKSGESASK